MRHVALVARQVSVSSIVSMMPVNLTGVGRRAGSVQQPTADAE